MNDGHWRGFLKERLTGLQVRPEREAEIIDELSQHLNDQFRDLLAGGMAPEAARAVALADLDLPGEFARRLAAIETRPPLALPPPGAPSRGRWLQARVQDVRHSIRSLKRSPIFACTVIGTLALTIGPMTAILSVGNWLVWRPTPGVSEPGRLAEARVGVWSDRGVNSVNVSNANLHDLVAAARTITGIAGIGEYNGHLAGDSLPAADKPVAAVTGDGLQVLGVPLVAGRFFAPEDDRLPLGEPVMLISSKLARRAFSADEAAIGKRLTLNGRPLTVVGVVAAHFQGTTPLSLIDVWYPSAAYAYVNHFPVTRQLTDRGGGIFNSFVVRLAPDVTLEEAQAELDVLFPVLADRHPDVNKQFQQVRARLTPGLGAAGRERFGSMVNVLLAVGAVLLVLGCANVANVLMMRAVRTSRDRAIRLALGASRARLAALQLTESAILALTGAGVGILLALWLKDVILWLIFPGLPPDFEIAVPLDHRVLLMTLAVSMTCGLVSGFVPALVSRATAPGAAMASGGRSITATRWLRGGLASLQLALSLALVTGSLLLGSALHQLYSLDLGFDPAHVSRHLINPSRQGYRPERRAIYYQELLGRLQDRPGLDAVALSGLSPFGSSFGVRLQDPEGADRPELQVLSNNVTAAYFDVLRMPIIRGRTFTDAESAAPAGASYPVVVDKGLARRLFGAADPIGRVVVMPATAAGPTRALPIIGVVGSTQWTDLKNERPLFLYQPFAASPRPSSMAMVRSSLSTSEVTQIVKAAAREIDPALPVRLSQPLSALIDSELTNERVFAWMLTLVGVLAFTLAAVGLYGLLAQLVAERTREFGIRLAIGSGRAGIFTLVLRQAAWIALFGTTVGLLLAGFGSRLIEAQLHGVSRLDLGTYALASLALAVVVFAAALWPARAATRIEPVEALRAE
jgi:predicted permease